VTGKFLEKLMGAPVVKPLLSNEQFSVGGTLLQAWAFHASLERIVGQDDPLPRHQALVMVMMLPRKKRNVPKSILAASSTATRPTAPASIPSP
jgi:hypothetical protein